MCVMLVRVLAFPSPYFCRRESLGVDCVQHCEPSARLQAERATVSSKARECSGRGWPSKCPYSPATTEAAGYDISMLISSVKNAQCS